MMQHDEKLERRFYVLRVISGKEWKAKEVIEWECEHSPLGRSVFQVLVPTEKVMQQRGQKKKVVERASMPGYVLIEAALSNEVIHDLRSLPDVVGFLGSDRPEPLAQHEVERMLRRADQGSENVGFDVSYEVGENVKVIDGAFSGFVASVEEVNPEKKKLMVMVKIFGRRTPLELSYTQVEKE